MERLSCASLRNTFKIAVILIGANSLSGCIVTLPPAIQAASFALDGISFATTGKTVSDHALSAVTEKDCAITRALNGAEICSDNAQLAELEMLERRLDSPSAQQLAKTVTPAHQDEVFQHASAQLSEHHHEDEILNQQPTIQPQMNVAQWPIF